MEKQQLPDKVYSMNITKQQAFTTFKNFKGRIPKAGRSLRGSHQLLARYLINFFIEDWNRRPLADREKGFSLHTNNRSLARLCDCTERSIRNQVIRLIETNVLMHSEMTGRGIRVWINPDAILDFNDADRKKDQVLVLEPDLVKNKTEVVDKPRKVYQQHSINKTNKNIEEHRLSRVENGFNNLGPGMGSVREYARQFWQYAKENIYWDQNFSPARDKVIERLIAGQFIRKLKTTDSDLWDLFFKQMTRLSYAKQWFADHPEVRPPDPYHYFSVSSDGFRFCKIEAWENLKHQARQVQTARAYMKKDIRQYRVGQITETKSSMIQRHGQSLRNWNSPRVEQWFTYRYPKLY